jgi:hypothetical protein
MDLLKIIDSSPFLSDFVSGAILFILASLLLPKYLYWKERPKLKLFPSGKNRKYFEFTKSTDDQWEASIKLRLVNRGSKTIERFYWEIYLDKSLLSGQPDHFMIYPGIEWMRNNIEDEYIHLYGYLEVPIFPLESIDFPYRLSIKTDKKRKVNIYYYFKTDRGQIPFWSWLAVWFKKYFLLNKLNVR